MSFTYVITEMPELVNNTGDGLHVFKELING